MKASDDLKREINQKAETLKEIVKKTGLGETTVGRHARELVESGKWRKVFKKVDGRFVHAYLKIK